MATPSGRSLMMLMRDFINSFKMIAQKEILVGKDQYGTLYYEKPLSPSTAVSQNRIRPRRWHIPRNINNIRQEMPPEWESWLRYRREAPPTVQEILNSAADRQKIKDNATELEEKRLASHPKSELVDPFQTPPQQRRGKRKINTFIVIDEYLDPHIKASKEEDNK